MLTLDKHFHERKKEFQNKIKNSGIKALLLPEIMLPSELSLFIKKRIENSKKQFYI